MSLVNNESKFIVRSGKVSFKGTPDMVPTFLKVLIRNTETEYLFELFELISEHPDDFAGMVIDVPNKTLFFTLLQIKNRVFKDESDEKKSDTKSKKNPIKEDTKEKPLEGFVMWYDVISKIKDPQKIKKFYVLCKTNSIVFELHENKPIPKPLYESFISEMKPKSDIENILAMVSDCSTRKRFAYEELGLPSM